MSAFPHSRFEICSRNSKRILTKEKIDKQLAGQTSSTPFMSVKDGLSKRVMFNTANNLEQKIDRLTVMMGKLMIENEGQSKPFQSQVYQPNRDRTRVEAIIMAE